MPCSWLVGRQPAAVVDAVAADHRARRAPVLLAADREADRGVVVRDLVADEGDALAMHRRARLQRAAAVAGRGRTVERHVLERQVRAALVGDEPAEERRPLTRVALDRDRRARRAVRVDLDVLLIGARRAGSRPGPAPANGRASGTSRTASRRCRPRRPSRPGRRRVCRPGCRGRRRAQARASTHGERAESGGFSSTSVSMALRSIAAARGRSLHEPNSGASLQKPGSSGPRSAPNCAKCGGFRAGE